MATATALKQVEEYNNDLIIVDSSPAEISVNYESVKQGLAAELQKYEIVVTADTVAGAKRLATDLNKNASEFNRLRKEAVEKVSGPIRVFEGQMKDLASMCTEGRKKILDQVKVFEDETLALAKEKMTSHLVKLWDDKDIDAEFRRASINDLVKLSSVTGKGNLTARVASDIDARAMNDKALQDQTKMRLVVLENQSYKAGLSAPLTRAHVESFLFEDETAYQTKLDAMLESEKERQTVTENALRTSLQKEAAPTLPTVKSDLESMVNELVETSFSEKNEDPEPAAVIQLQTKNELAPEQPEENLVEYAYGPLDSISSAQFKKTTRTDIELLAITENPTGNIGIWTAEGLITQILRDESVTA